MIQPERRPAGDRLGLMGKTKKAMRKKKSAGKKLGVRRSTLARRTKGPARRKKVTRPSRRSRPRAVARTTRGPAPTDALEVTTLGRRGLGARSAGQSGDTQGLSAGEWVDSERVEELVEEGQDVE